MLIFMARRPGLLSYEIVFRVVADAGGGCTAGQTISYNPEDFEDPNGPFETTYQSPTPQCLDNLEGNALSLVYSKMPLADLRKTIESLAAMQGTTLELDRFPGGLIADCQALADQDGIVQNSTWGFDVSPVQQAKWQEAGCSASASWLAPAWEVRSRRSLDYDGDGIADLAVFRPSDSNWRPLSGNAYGVPTLHASLQD